MEISENGNCQKLTVQACKGQLYEVTDTLVAKIHQLFTKIMHYACLAIFGDKYYLHYDNQN